jgi:hypothetical protein
MAAGLRFVPRSAEVRSNSTAMSSLEVLPATPVRGKAGLLPKWVANVNQRIEELGQLSENWDTYGDSPLQEGAVETLSDLLIKLYSFIQSPPSISLSDAGGLVAEWSSSQSSLELLADPGHPPSVYYCEVSSNREWEMSISECDSLDKWLWRASSTV